MTEDNRKRLEYLLIDIGNFLLGYRVSFLMLIGLSDEYIKQLRFVANNCIEASCDIYIERGNANEIAAKSIAILEEALGDRIYIIDSYDEGFSSCLNQLLAEIHALINDEQQDA